MSERPPRPPRRTCIVNGCGEPPRYPNRNESSFCATHDDPDNPETRSWQVARSQREPELEVLRKAASRLTEAIADRAAVIGLGLGWKAEMDAEDAFLCALQDTRTALDGRERPHVHRALAQPAPDASPNADWHPTPANQAEAEAALADYRAKPAPDGTL